MRIFFAFCLFCFFVNSSYGQKNRKIFKINPGQTYGDVIPLNEVYLLPKFTFGYVEYKDRANGQAKMNFNILVREMEFIDEKGDTLSIADEEMIKKIIIEKDTFYYKEGYLYSIKKYGDYFLSGKQYFYFSNRQTIGPHGSLSSSSIETARLISSSGNPLRDLVQNEIITLAKNTDYFLGDKYGNFVPANKKNIMKLYSKQEKKIVQYFSEHPSIDYTNEEEIKSLLAFITS
jgi:hypothetical protein